jgi:outer membrane protein assembly factor BamB/regulation of enolase protein 1 (concanavalin A-like superfamily)
MGVTRTVKSTMPSRLRTTVLAVLAALVVGLGMHHASALAATNDEWPTSLHDPQRTAASNDTNIPAAAATQLTKLWSFATGGPVATTPTVSAGTAYFGSWDGYEYAVDATTGALRWKTFLGITTASPICTPPQVGISSPATVQNGVLYVGGGDSYWYAVDAASGAVLWRVFTGDNSAAGGYYNWSGPLISNGYAYIGIASEGDCPLVQGQLLKVSLATHAIENTANIVPNGEIGGGIWTSPALDPATNTIYVATGTENSLTQQNAQALVSIDANSMEIKDHWKVPETQTVLDSDFGTSTTLFNDGSGRSLVASINKNGFAYAFDRTNLSVGPVWEQSIAQGGQCPTCGQSSVSSGAFGQGKLYLGGGDGVINGTGYPGTVSALNPSNGKYLWQHAAPGIVIGALAYDNGMVFDGGGSVLEVLDAGTGTRLYSYDTGSQIYAGPSIANGIIYTGNVAGTVTAFAEPSVTPPPPPDPNCPAGFTCQDIGNPSPSGSEITPGADWTVTAGGGGVAGTSDAFRLMSKTTAGDAQVTAQVKSQAAVGVNSQAGVMIRQTSDPGSPYYAVMAKPNNTLVVSYRKLFGQTTTMASMNAAGALPLYLMVQRRGDTFQAATSVDGSTYTLLPGTNSTLPLPAASLAGVVVSSGTNGTAGTATLSAVALAAPGSPPSPAASPSPCPNGWSCQDVGNPSMVGDQSLSTGTWTVKGAGKDVWGTSDEFHYVWQSLAGDGTVSAHVASQTNSDPGAKAGVMLRGGSGARDAYYAAFVTPGNGIEVQYRDTSGLTSAQVANPSGSAPAYLQVARSGASFTAYTSTDGSTWTPVAKSTVSEPRLAGSIVGGLAVTSKNPGAPSTATFDSVVVGGSAPPAPNLCPSGWSCADVGFPTPHGGQVLNKGDWSVEAGGGDIWGTADQFRMIAQSQGSDGTISAQVAAQENTDGFAKSGVMIRLSDSPNAPYYAVLVTPSHGVLVQYRTSQGGASAQLTIGGATPTYLRVGRVGNTFSGYTSVDGATWRQISGSSVSIPGLTGNLLAGMAVCSHNTNAANTTVFKSVEVTGGTIGGNGMPGPWTDGDVGGATPSGNATFAGGTFTVQGGGNDIWASVDQFNYVSQPLTGDASIVAAVTGQDNTDPWAKAGVMIKQSTTAGSPYALMATTPGNGLSFQYGFNTSISGGAYSWPVWLRLDRAGSVLTAYSSPDGTNWTKVGQAVIDMTGTVTVGLAVSSHNSSVLNTTAFQDVTITPTGGGPLPAPWANGDISGPSIPGSASFAGDTSTFTVKGSGSDIWGTVDQLQYVSQPVIGDAAITARVTGQDNTNPWAKSGVIFKASNTPGAQYVLLAVTPGNGIRMEYNFSNDVGTGGFAFPNAWLRLKRLGNIFIADTSSDGTNWTQVGSVQLNMTSTATVGLFVNSHNTSALNTTTFDSVAANQAAGGSLPSGWASVDVGSPQLAGSASFANNTFTVNGGGTDIWGSQDQFQYAEQPLTGEGSVTARVTAQENTNGWAKAGVMIKQNTIAGSPYAMLAVTPSNGMHLQSNFNADQGGGNFSLPIWLRLTKLGGTITAYRSADGNAWTRVGSTNVALTSPATVGLFVSSHNPPALNTTNFDNVAVNLSAGGSLPSGWTSTDVGTPQLAGSASFANSTFTVNGAGTDIWGSQDQFQYVEQALPGDGSVTARVTGQENTDSWAKSGVMIKQNTAAGSSYAMLAVTPGNGIHFQSNFNADQSGGTYSLPTWLRLTRLGGAITSYKSTDGSTWTRVGSTNVSFASPVTFGLFVTSHSPAALNTTTFDNVTVSFAAGGSLPSGWTSTDVGTPQLAGTASFANSTFTVNGAGTDIWGSQDQFQYVEQALPGDGSVTARVTGQENTDSWAKSGVMIKQSTAAGSSYAMLAVTPGNGIHFQSNFNTDQSGGPFSLPVWVRLTKAAGTVTAYTSTDGATWTTVGSTSVSLTSPATIGLFVCSHNNASLNTSTFDNVSVTP